MRRRRVWLAGLLVLGVLAAGGALLPPSRGRIPGFDGAPRAVAERMRVDVDGFTITMLVRGRDDRLPVLLLLGGGPGIPGYLLECLRPTGLAEDFIVAYPEYRGTGLSRADGVVAGEMTAARYLQDVEALTDALRRRFDQDKIVLMGALLRHLSGVPGRCSPPRALPRLRRDVAAGRWASDGAGRPHRNGPALPRAG